MARRKTKSGGLGRSRKGLPVELRRYCQAFTQELADALHEVVVQGTRNRVSKGFRKISGITGATVVAAASELLDRGWGRPPQSLDIGAKKQSIFDFTDEEIAVLAHAMGHLSDQQMAQYAMASGEPVLDLTAANVNAEEEVE